MSIRTNYTGDQGMQRKIDQCYELAALANADGDTKDAERYMKRIERLKNGEQD